MKRVLPLVALVVATNMAMLASARANRRGAADLLRVTQRELMDVPVSDRDSAVRVSLRYVQPSIPGWVGVWGNPGYSLDRSRLTALGFACLAPSDPAKSYSTACGLPRRAFVALEYDGPAWHDVRAAYLRQLEETRSKTQAQGRYSEVKRLEDLANFGTRFVAIDVSLDAAALRRAHPEPGVVILPVVVRALLSPKYNAPASDTVMTGTIELLTTSLLVPARDRHLVPPTSSYQLEQPPQYAVDLAIGSHHEPWIQSIAAIDATVAPR